METKTLSTDELDEWFDYYERLPVSGPYHNPTYISFLEGNFEFPDAESVELFVLEDGDDFVYYPYFIRPIAETAFDSELPDVGNIYDIVSSWYYGGPLLSDPNRTDVARQFVETFSEYCRRNDIIAEFLRFDPNIRNDRWFEELDPEAAGETVPVDLEKSLDTIWEEYTSSNRTHIRTARDAGFSVYRATDHGEVAAFHDIYCDAMDAKDASEHYRFTLDFFAEMILETPELATLLVSEYEGEIVGGSYLVHEDETVNEFLRTSTPDLWDLGLNNHICQRAIEHMHDRGFRRLDFQGGRPGVFQFKKAFSPERGQFHVGRRIHNERIYEELVAAAEERGVNTDDSYFPEYRRAMSN